MDIEDMLCLGMFTDFRSQKLRFHGLQAVAEDVVAWQNHPLDSV